MATAPRPSGVLPWQSTEPSHVSTDNRNSLSKVKMPHASTIFSKYASPTGHQHSPDKARPQRNRLKKRLPFGYSESNVVSYDLSKLMGNHHSIEKVPRPTRPPRPSATDIPDLPGLPIYKTFASGFRPTTLLDDNLKPSLPFQNDKPFESATGWILENSTPTPVPGEDDREENKQPPLERQGNYQTTPRFIPIPQKPPQYDRASRLAESYQSLLPDLDSMDYPEAHSAYPEAHPALHRQHSDQRLRHHDQWHQRYNPHTSGQASPHRLRHAPRPGTAPTTSVSWLPPHPPRSSGGGTHSARASSIITDSSATAVESDGSPIDRFSTTSEMFPIQGVTKDCTHVDKLDRSNSNSESETQYTSYLASKRTPSPGKDKDPRDRDRPRLSSSDYVGLQICSDLLTDELLKTFFRQHPNEKRGRASKLQVLLLIEAYEAMLDNCRKELINVPLRSESVEKERERGQRRRHIRDAVRILDHWLDSLYVIYDETFGDLPEGGDKSGGGGRRKVRESARGVGEGVFREGVQGGGF